MQLERFPINDAGPEVKDVQKFIHCHPLCFPYFDEICYENPIGKIAIKILLRKLDANNETLNLEIGDHNGFDEEKNTITINPTYFDSEGRAKYTFCGVQNGEIVGLHETISEAIFRELCRALHKDSAMKIEGSVLLDSIYGERQEKYLWVNDENVHVTTVYYHDKETGAKKFNPICSNMYTIFSGNLCQQVFACYYVRYKKNNGTPYKIEEFLIDHDKYVRFPITKASEGDD
jgi:hypothetical protein